MAAATDATYRQDDGDTHVNIPKKHPVLKASYTDVKNIFHRFDIHVGRALSLSKDGSSETAEPLGHRLESIAVLRLDGDMYSSTWDVLTWVLYRRGTRRGFVIIDDYALSGARLATHDFRACVNSVAN